MGSRPNWHRLASVLDKRLNNQEWICGNSVTLADIAVAAPMHLYKYQKLPLEKYPNIYRWMTQFVEELPCWKATDVTQAFGLKAN